MQLSPKALALIARVEGRTPAVGLTRKAIDLVGHVEAMDRITQIRLANEALDEKEQGRRRYVKGYQAPFLDFNTQYHGFPID